jgi:hypothetical protein
MNNDPVASAWMNRKKSKSSDPVAEAWLARKKGTSQKPEQENYGIGRSAAVLGKSAISGAVGAIPDTLSMIYNLPAMGYNAYKGEDALPLIPSVSEKVNEGIDAITGDYTKTPETGTLANLAMATDFAGGTLSPAALAGKALRKGLSKTAKALNAFGSKNPAELAAAATSGYTLKALEDEGPVNLLASLAAGMGTKKALNKTNLFSKFNPQNQKANQLERALAPLMAIGSNPKAEVLAAAKRQNMELPLSVLLNSPLSRFTENNLLDTYFRSPRYTKRQNAIHTAIPKRVSEIADRLTPNRVDEGEINDLVRNALIERGDELTDTSKHLYKSAQQKIRPHDKVILRESVPAAEMLLKDVEGLASESQPTKFATTRAQKFLEKFGGERLSPEERDFYASIDQRAYPTRGGTGFGGEIENTMPLKDAAFQRSEYLQDIGFNSPKELLGKKNKLGLLIQGLTEDIKNAPNQEYVKEWEKAAKHYREEYIPVMRDKLFLSLKTGDPAYAKEVTSAVNSKQDFQKLKQFLKGHPAEKKILEAFQKLKFGELTGDLITNSDGKISYAKLYNLIQGKDKKSEFFKAIAGENYQDLVDIGKITASLVEGSRPFKNFSRTASNAFDITKAGLVANATLNLLTGEDDGKDALAFFGAAAPYALSRLLSNPRYLKAVKRYALAKQKGNSIAVQHYGNLLTDIARDIVKGSAIAPIRSQARQDEERRKFIVHPDAVEAQEE